MGILTAQIPLAILKGIWFAFLACAPIGFLAFAPSLQEILTEYVFVWVALIAFLVGVISTFLKDKDDDFELF